MSRYFVSSAKVNVPVSFKCPYCGEDNLYGIRCIGRVSELVDVRHPAREAAEKAEAGARGQVKDQIAALYQMSPEALGAEVERKCSRCKATMPWVRTQAMKRSGRMEAAGTILLSGTVLIAIFWLIVSLVVGFSVYFLWYLLIAGAVDALFLVYVVKAGGREQAAAEKQQAQRAERLKGIPAECLPRLTVPMEQVLAEVQT